MAGCPIQASFAWVGLFVESVGRATAVCDNASWVTGRETPTQANDAWVGHPPY